VKHNLQQRHIYAVYLGKTIHAIILPAIEATLCPISWYELYTQQLPVHFVHTNQLHDDGNYHYLQQRHIYAVYLGKTIHAIILPARQLKLSLTIISSATRISETRALPAIEATLCRISWYELYTQQLPAHQPFCQRRNNATPNHNPYQVY
jgi:hypothetical protein